MLAGVVMTDRVHADELLTDADLDRAGDDRDLDLARSRAERARGLRAISSSLGLRNRAGSNVIGAAASFAGK